MWAQMRREGGSCEVLANEYSCTHWAQINFGDLTPYLTYVYLGTPRHYLATPHISNTVCIFPGFRQRDENTRFLVSFFVQLRFTPAVQFTFFPGSVIETGTRYFWSLFMSSFRLTFSWIGQRDGNTRFLDFFMTYIKTFFSGCINKWNINIQYRITSS